MTHTPPQETEKLEEEKIKEKSKERFKYKKGRVQ